MSSPLARHDGQFRLSSRALGLSVGVLVLAASCAADDMPGSRAPVEDGEGDGDGDGDGDDQNEETGDGDGDGDADDDQEEDDRPMEVVGTLPDGFTPGTTAGGYQVLGTLEEFEEPTDNSCVNVLRAVIRDFQQAHIDFGEEKPATWTAPGLYTGHVLDMLGEDKKPVINPDRTPLDVIESLDDWYRNIEGVNAPYVMDLWLEPDPERPGSFVFDMNNFFPLDDHNVWPDDVQNGGEGEASGPHNFLFTTEIHTSFEYAPGQVFSFRGDDDVFVYIDDKLVVDLGGIHGPVSGSVDLDELGLQVGEVYSLDMFQAERNPGGSNFQIDTSLDFKECVVIPL
jgi:fibro-slime domain-containing protein